MRADTTDQDWETFAQTDPYWAVITLDRYRRDQLTDEALREFFHTGEYHVESLLGLIDRHLGPVKRRSCLDLGCGVGRVLIPLARQFRRAVGVDVSESMLAEARRHCAEQALGNVELVRGLEGLEGPFDLVHTYIVLQHVPPARGEQLVEGLLRLLADGGVGAVHLTYRNTHLPPPPARIGLRTRAGRAWRAVKEAVAGRFRPRQVLMQMNEYSLNTLCARLQQHGVRRTFVEFSDHGGVLGTMLIFRKEPGTPYRF
jgi:SAM-dependent methyltransferase